MKERFIVTSVYKYGAFNIYDKERKVYANCCGIWYVKSMYKKHRIEEELLWGLTERTSKEYKKVNLPLEAYLLLN